MSDHERVIVHMDRSLYTKMEGLEAPPIFHEVLDQIVAYMIRENSAESTGEAIVKGQVIARITVEFPE